MANLIQLTTFGGPLLVSTRLAAPATVGWPTRVVIGQGPDPRPRDPIAQRVVVVHHHVAETGTREAVGDRAYEAVVVFLEAAAAPWRRKALDMS